MSDRLDTLITGCRSDMGDRQRQGSEGPVTHRKETMMNCSADDLNNLVPHSETPRRREVLV